MSEDNIVEGVPGFVVDLRIPTPLERMASDPDLAKYLPLIEAARAYAKAVDVEEMARSDADVLAAEEAKDAAETELLDAAYRLPEEGDGR